MLELEQPVVAYRLWYTERRVYDWDDPFLLDRPRKERLLLSMSNSRPWVPGKNVAQCHKPQWIIPNTEPPLVNAYETDHTRGSPGVDCLCGLHGLSRPENVNRWIFGQGMKPYVVGAVLLWGRLLSGGRTVRASHAAPVALLKGRLKNHDIAEKYGLRLCSTVAELRYYATEYGDELTSEQIKELRAKP